MKTKVKNSDFLTRFDKIYTQFQSKEIPWSCIATFLTNNSFIRIKVYDFGHRALFCWVHKSVRVPKVTNSIKSRQAIKVFFEKTYKDKIMVVDEEDCLDENGFCTYYDS